MNESTQQLLTTISENIKKIYENGENTGRETDWYNTFWDAFQDNGERNMYNNAFSNESAYTNTAEHYGNWDAKSLIPKYPIRPMKTDAVIFSGVKIDDFKKHCETYNIIVDWSQCTALGNCYRNFKTKYLPDIDASSSTSLSSSFYWCTELLESPDIINGSQITTYANAYTDCNKMTRVPTLWATNVTNFSGALGSCSSLKNIDKIEGEIQVSFNVQSCPLNIESFKKVITHLKNYSGTSSEYTCTLTVKSASYASLEAEGATAEYNGVACTWTELIDNFKWNLVKK